MTSLTSLSMTRFMFDGNEFGAQIGMKKRCDEDR